MNKITLLVSTLTFFVITAYPMHLARCAIRSQASAQSRMASAGTYMPKRNFWFKEPDVNSTEFKRGIFTFRSTCAGAMTALALNNIANHHGNTGLITMGLAGYFAAHTVDAWHEYKKAEAREDAARIKCDNERFRNEVAVITKLAEAERKYKTASKPD